MAATVLALTVAHNTKGKRDASRAFIPEAERFTAYWRDQGLHTRLVKIDNRKPNVHRRRQVVDAIMNEPRVQHLAIFAHGWRGGIQMGFRMGHMRALARVIEQVAPSASPIVSLYCCSTAQGGAGGDGGFADELRDALCAEGLVDCRVDGHSTRGHTTRNPHMRRFDGEGSWIGGQGGRYLIRPRGKLWGAWKRALRDRDDPLRYRMSRMTIAEIHDWLSPMV